MHATELFNIGPANPARLPVLLPAPVVVIRMNMDAAVLTGMLDANPAIAILVLIVAHMPVWRMFVIAVAAVGVNSMHVIKAGRTCFDRRVGFLMTLGRNRHSAAKKQCE